MGKFDQSKTSVAPIQQPRAMRAVLALLLLLCFGVQSLSAQAAPQTRLVVRDKLGLTNLLNLCKLLGCSVDHGLGDPSGQLFLIKTPRALNAITALLNINLGIISIETDQVVQTQGSGRRSCSRLSDRHHPGQLLRQHGWRGYLTQPGNQLILTDQTHASSTPRERTSWWR